MSGIVYNMNAVMVTATLPSGAMVYCALPGGRPRFMVTPDADWCTSITDAPTCWKLTDFRAFVEDRFPSKPPSVP